MTGAFFLIAILWGGFLGMRHLNAIDSALDRLEYLTVDWRYQLAGGERAPRGVTIIAIDDDALRESGGYPVPRSILARIVRRLAADGPQVIAFDMLFLDASNSESDREFADALRSTKSVVAAIGEFDAINSRPSADHSLRTDDLALAPRPSSVLRPIADIQDVTRMGLVNLSTDHSGIPRFVPLLFNENDGILPSFALAVSSAALNTEPVIEGSTVKLAGRVLPLDHGYHMPIRYYGPKGSFRQLSAARVLRGDFDANQIRGQVVLVGATATGLGDVFATPFDRRVPGVEIFANAITNVLAGDDLIRTTAIRRVDALAAVLLPAIAVLLMAMRRAWLGALLVALVLGVWLAAIFAGFRAGYWFNVAIPLAAVLPVAAGYGSARLVLDRQAKTRLEREAAALSKFQSPQLIAYILNHPDFLQTPVHQNAAIVFLDLSHFTEVAEALGPHWTRDLLADFHALSERCVVEHGGYVGAFMGDGAMIIFGLPQPKPDDAARAIRAIAQLGRVVTDWLGGLPPVARDRLSARIGGHAGPVVVSRLGPAHHQHVTASGDTVNVASRLLEIAKQQSANIIVSDDLCEAARPSGSLDAALDAASTIAVSIRGRAEPLRVRVWR